MKGIRGILHIFSINSSTVPCPFFLSPVGERKSTGEGLFGFEIKGKKPKETQTKSAKNPETFPIRFVFDPPLSSAIISGEEREETDDGLSRISRSLMAASMSNLPDPSALASASSSSSSSIFTNFPLISAFVAFVLAQSIKVLTTWYKERRWDLKQFIASGGMPSSHSATVTALAAAVGLQDGIGSSIFAAALILACIVMYDATGVRLQAGLQAEVLNQIVYELPAEHPLAESRPLRELLGHTPPQVVAGGLLGLVTAAMIHVIVSIASRISS